MTVDLFAGASSNKVSDWQAIDWPKVRHQVRRLQLRIAKAIRAGRHGKAQALAWLNEPPSALADPPAPADRPNA